MLKKMIFLKKSKKEIKGMLLYMITVIFTSIFPVVFLYSQNASEIKFQDFFANAISFGSCGILIYFLLIIFKVSCEKSSLITSIIMLLFTNFVIIEKALKYCFKFMKYWHVLLLLIIIVLHIFWIIFKFLDKENAKSFASILGVVFCVLCLFNIIMATPKIISKLEVNKNNFTLEKEVNNIDTSLPNFYYIIFDEYGGYTSMRDYYKYDNSADITYFKDLGFNVSEKSYAATGNTLIETANLFNLDYVVGPNVDNIETVPYRKNAEFFKLLTEKGYCVKGVGVQAEDEYDLESAYKVNTANATTIDGKTLKDLLVENTYMYPLLKNKDKYDDYRKEQIKSLDFFTDIKNYKEGGQFYFLHINSPHMPFVFNENGDALELRYSADWTNKKIYLDQHKYMTAWMKKIAKSIIENDPDSIIVFQSDHGFRGGHGTMSKEITMNQALNTLNSVYYKGENISIEGLTPINTLRTILNKLFDMDYNMLSIPEGMYNNEE